jgi:hypothetical protein
MMVCQASYVAVSSSAMARESLMASRQKAPASKYHLSIMVSIMCSFSTESVAQGQFRRLADGNVSCRFLARPRAFDGR